MNILVTGGAGFIASHIVDRLIKLGYNTIIMDNFLKGKKENLNSQASFYQLDITSPEIRDIFIAEEITHVIHHAGQVSVQESINNPFFDARSNILGTINLLESCREFAVEKIIYASSAAVYGEPEYLPLDEEHPIKTISPYGLSKHTPEHYIQMYQHLYGLDYTILRYANAYGPRQDAKGEGGVISIFIDKILSSQTPIIYGDGEQTRDFIYVGDIVEANISSLTAGDGEILNISTNLPIGVKQIYRTINQIMDKDIKVNYQPARRGDIRDSYLDNSRAKETLNWHPTFNLRKGLIHTLDYMIKEEIY